MTKTGSKVIPQLNQFIEKLDNLSLNDRDGWCAMAREVAALDATIPGQMKSIRTLLTRCRQAIDAIAQKSLSDYLAIIDAIADGFEAAQYYLENGSDRKTRLQKAIDRLEELLSSACQEEDEAVAPPEDEEMLNPSVSIDDAAAMLVQADATNADEWREIQTVLERLSVADHYPDAVRAILRDAGVALQTMLASETGLTDDPADLIGAKIQAAMDLFMDKTQCVPVGDHDGTFEKGADTNPTNADGTTDETADAIAASPDELPAKDAGSHQAPATEAPSEPQQQDFKRLYAG